MAILGLDIGKKRIGVAISKDKVFSFPLKVIENRGLNDFVEDIKKLIDKYKVEFIVVGMPKSLKGKDTEISRFIESYIEALSNIIEVKIEDERFTTDLSLLFLRGNKKKKILKDKVSASLILSSFLKRNYDNKL